MRKTAAIALVVLAAALLDLAPVVHGNGAGSAGNPARLDANINAAGRDYDGDDDGLIEVSDLAQLDAIRWDRDGNGVVDDGVTPDDTASYAAAFPDPAAGMGCPAPGCKGYELTQSLDFDTDGDGAAYTAASTWEVTGDSGDARYNDGAGWLPIGSRESPYNAAFDGNGHAIANLFINTPAATSVGLFGGIGAAGAVRNLGLIEVNVVYSAPTTGSVVSSLVGVNLGTVTNCYAGGAVAGSGARLTTIGGLVGALRAGGTITNSHAAVAVSGRGGATVDNRDRIGGLVGTAVHSGTAITASYATGSVSSGNYSRVGGLVGSLWLEAAITSSYATGAVTGGAYSSVGGLVGLAGDEGGYITASYAAGPVAGGGGAVSGVAPTTGAGGLVGYTEWRSRITDSYAIGAVSAGAGSNTGGLSAGGGAKLPNSYWDPGSTGQTSNDNGNPETTRDLQSPTSNEGIYENWQSTQWDFGTARQYPAVKHNGRLVPGQRQTSLQVDWNQPVVGEPVVAGLHLTAGASGIVWQWQRSSTGAEWTDIADATAAVYVPVAADAADGGQYLRAQVTFTAAGKSQTLTTFNTARVAAARTVAGVGGTAAFTPEAAVGQRLSYAVSAVAGRDSGAGGSDANWRWQRCADRTMRVECRYLPHGAASYTITAADVGKYLRAYVYYTDGGAWRRAVTPILGPVIDPETADFP